MIIVWRGLGFLVPLLLVVSMLLFSRFTANDSLSGGLALLITAAITFPAGKKLNATERLHTLFWMPMQWWAVILGVFGVLVIFGNR